MAPGLLVGVDETGRGSCVGPIITCAVAFPAAGLDPALAVQLADSKALSDRRRRRAAAALRAAVFYAFGAASATEVDALNPLRATMLAMARAVGRLRCPIAYVKVDGLNYPPLALPGEAVVKGDSLVAEISAASILAKVFRDDLIARLARRHPVYGLERHAGYGTAQHFRAIAERGPTPHHRRTFIRKALEPQMTTMDLFAALPAARRP